LIAALLMCACAANLNPEARTRETLQAELFNLEQSLTQSFIEGDTDVARSALTEDFQFVDSTGDTAGKEDVLANMTGPKQIESCRLSNPSLIAYDDTTATLAYTQDIVLTSGKPMQVSVINTFIKQNDRWLLRSSQQSEVK